MERNHRRKSGKCDPGIYWSFQGRKFILKPKPLVIVIVGLILFLSLLFVKDSPGVPKPDEKEKLSNMPDATSAPGMAVEELFGVQSEDRSTRWYHSDSPGKLKGVALVIHGLNLRPARMQPIISELNDSGIDVLGLSLRGHGDNYTHYNGVDEDQARLEAFKNVSHQLWMNEAYLAYLQLNERGNAKGVPRFLAAFSLGGLIGLDLFAANPEVQFNKLVLFAPAIRLHTAVYLERVLSPFPRLVIPSMAPKTYLANKRGTPIAAYNALFDSLEQFNQKAGPKLNVPALVFIDARDEFIPLGKLKKLAKEKVWNQWQFYIVEKDKAIRDDIFFHHIIDASSTGETVWQDMMKAVVQHLLE